jgi:hypothetical protein
MGNTLGDALAMAPVALATGAACVGIPSRNCSAHHCRITRHAIAKGREAKAPQTAYAIFHSSKGEKQMTDDIDILTGSDDLAAAFNDLSDGKRIGTVLGAAVKLLVTVINDTCDSREDKAAMIRDVNKILTETLLETH